MLRKGFVSLLAFTVLLGGLIPAVGANVNTAHAEEGASKNNPDDTKSLLDDLFGGNKNNGTPGNDHGSGSGNDNASGSDGGKDAGNQPKPSPSPKVQIKLVEDNYDTVWKAWKEQGVTDSTGFEQVIHPAEFKLPDGKAPALSAAGEGYDEASLLWNDSIPSVEFKVQVPKDGFYQIFADYKTVAGKFIPAERGVQVNGVYPFFEARRAIFPRVWKNDQETFEQDAVGNEQPPGQKEEFRWQTTAFMDASYLFDEPFRYYLKQGDNTVKLLYVREALQLGRIRVVSPESLPTYEQYKTATGSDMSPVKSLVTIEAEHPEEKSEPSIQAAASADPNVTPYRSGIVTLNTLGGESWKDGGQSATWNVHADKAGSYQIAFKYSQSVKLNMPAFRTVLIDGKVPFDAMNRYKFDYASSWKNEILSSGKGDPYQFNLTEGDHKLTLIADAAPYQPVIQTIRSVMKQLNAMSLDIKMATGNTKDTNRDWDITGQMPDIVPSLQKYSAELRRQYDYLKELSGTKPDEARGLLISADQIDSLVKQPNQIPYHFSQIAEGSGSITQKLGDLLNKLPNQPLQFDKIYVFNEQKLPKANASWWQSFKSTLVNFILSFTKDYSKINANDKDAIQVWVNRPRQYVALMQQMADKQFTKEKGVKVSLSLMPNEQKLILANSAGSSPDVALGVSNWIPFNMSIRGAMTDMKQFPDYEQVLKRFSPGAMLPFEYNGGMYAVPETQNFFVLYYRKDILDSLQLPVPQTWEEVQQMLPKLQRYGMNFYDPLATGAGFKPFALTVPFIYQNGGSLYAEDGMKSAIDQEQSLNGLKLMSNLFTIYNLPLQVPNFYNHFREGTLPIGIADFNTYIQLTSAAPELAGWWKIAPIPGIRKPDGQIDRSAPGTGSSAMIFKSSKNQDKAWEFIKWWTSAETQRQFGNSIEATYGPTYRWNTSNLEAFDQLPWPDEDIRVINEQWKWLRDVPHIPGDYMLEREISNAWNRVVFDGVNPRRAIEDAVISSDREIKIKLEEFGYLQGGKQVKPLQMPDIGKQPGGGDTP